MASSISRKIRSAQVVVRVLSNGKIGDEQIITVFSEKARTEESLSQARAAALAEATEIALEGAPKGSLIATGGVTFADDVYTISLADFVKHATKEIAK